MSVKALVACTVMLSSFRVITDKTFKVAVTIKFFGWIAKVTLEIQDVQILIKIKREKK